MKIVRLGVCALVAFEVLALGGVLPWAEAILELGAVGLFLLWGVLAIRRRAAEIHWNSFYLPLLGLGVIAIIQYAFGFTASSYLTKVELLKWGAYVLLVFLTCESSLTESLANHFVWFLIMLGFFVSLFAIAQHFTFNGKLYWFMPLSERELPFGPFINRDHFAGFVELTAPLGLALLLFGTWRREHLILLILFTVIPIGALALSASRGGIIGFLFELVLLLFLSRTHQLGRKQLLAVTTLVLFAGTFIVWLGVSEAIQRFAQLTPGEISRDRRVSMYRDTWQIFTHHPWLGTGLGTLVTVYPHYETFYDGLTVDHTHNDYLELLADTGLVGGICGVAFIILLFWRGLMKSHSAERRLARAIYSGALAACAGLLLHSLVDFNLHIPANALIFLLLASLTTIDITVSRSAEHRPAKSRVHGASMMSEAGFG